MEAEIRMARLVEAFGKVRRGGLSRVAAAAALGLSERHFRRLYGAYEADGAEAIVDRRRGRIAANRAGPDLVAWVEAQYRARYFDFSAKHFHEALTRAHPHFRYGYTWTKSVLYHSVIPDARSAIRNPGATAAFVAPGFRVLAWRAPE